MQTRFFLSDAWKHRVRAWKGSWTLKGGNRNFFAEPYHIWSQWWWPTERQKHKQRSFFSIPWSTQFEPGKKHSSQSSKERQECVWNPTMDSIGIWRVPKSEWTLMPGSIELGKVRSDIYQKKDKIEYIYMNELWTVKDSHGITLNLFQYSKIQINEPGILGSIEFQPVIQRQELQEHGSFLKLILIEFCLKWSITPDGAWKGSFLGRLLCCQEPSKIYGKTWLAGTPWTPSPPKSEWVSSS